MSTAGALARLPAGLAEDCCRPAKRPLLDDAEAAERAALFAALADSTRIKIVALLAKVEELCVCDINANFDLGASTMSHHLKVLRRANLIASRRRGTWLYYRLAPDAALDVRQLVP